MQPLALALHNWVVNAVSGVCSIVGVSVQSPSDQTTWAVNYADAKPSAQCVSLAQAAVLSFDLPSFNAKASADAHFRVAKDAGVAVVTIGNAGNTATYALDDASRENLTTVINDIRAGAGLPGGGSTFYWQDINGVPHQFDAAGITALYNAGRSYYYALTVAQATEASGGQWQPPSQPVTATTP